MREGSVEILNTKQQAVNSHAEGKREGEGKKKTATEILRTAKFSRNIASQVSQM